MVNCIRTIYLFSAAYPPILSGSNASTLLPYLKNASTVSTCIYIAFLCILTNPTLQPEELATSDYLLKIFRVSMPHMPKTAAKFGHELQAALQPMILKPSTGGTHVSFRNRHCRSNFDALFKVLQEAVACMCIVVQNLTHDFVRLVNLMKSCNGLSLHSRISRIVVSHNDCLRSRSASNPTTQIPRRGIKRRAGPTISYLHCVVTCRTLRF